MYNSHAYNAHAGNSNSAQPQCQPHPVAVAKDCTTSSPQRPYTNGTTYRQSTAGQHQFNQTEAHDHYSKHTMYNSHAYNAHAGNSNSAQPQCQPHPVAVAKDCTTSSPQRPYTNGTTYRQSTAGQHQFNQTEADLIATLLTNYSDRPLRQKVVRHQATALLEQRNNVSPSQASLLQDSSPTRLRPAGLIATLSTNYSDRPSIVHQHQEMLDRILLHLYEFGDKPRE